MFLFDYMILQQWNQICGKSRYSILISLSRANRNLLIAKVNVVNAQVRCLAGTYTAAEEQLDKQLRCAIHQGNDFLKMGKKRLDFGFRFNQ